MIKECVVNFTPIKNESILASNRIALFIAAKQKCPIFDSIKTIRLDKYDRIWIVNGVWLYCNYREALLRFLQKNMESEIIWIGNDYTIAVPSQIKKVVNKIKVIAAYESIKPDHYYLNWNQLTFEAGHKWSPPRYDGLMYYGAYRKDREKYFDTYFKNNEILTVTIHPSSKGASKKFATRYPNAMVLGDLNVMLEAGRYESTIYMEDQSTHSIYCSPANRFYECLSAGLYQVFDINSVATLQKAGIDVSPWVVANQNDIKNTRSKLLRQLQFELYQRLNSREELLSQFERLIKAL